MVSLQISWNRLVLGLQIRSTGPRAETSADPSRHLSIAQATGKRASSLLVTENPGCLIRLELLMRIRRVGYVPAAMLQKEAHYMLIADLASKVQIRISVRIFTVHICAVVDQYRGHVQVTDLKKR